MTHRRRMTGLCGGRSRAALLPPLLCLAYSAATVGVSCASRRRHKIRWTRTIGHCGGQRLPSRECGNPVLP